MSELKFSFNDLRQLMDPAFVNEWKINCIKHLRHMTGASLRETKDFFDNEWLPFINGECKPPDRIKELVKDSPEFAKLQREFYELVQEVNLLKQQQILKRTKTMFED